MNISFVIPCYKSQNTVRSVVDEIEDTLKDKNNYSYEIILISDNSPDRVYNIIKDMAFENKRIKGVELSNNFGQHSALMAGYNLCSGDVVVSLDDDGQTPANEVLKLIDKINEGYDVVYGSYDDKKHSVLRNLGSKVNDYMSEALISKPRNLKISSFFVTKKFVIDEMIKYNKPYPYLLGLVLRTTSNICNVSVTHRTRETGRSGYTFKKLISLWLNGFTAFSVKPLRIATVIGFLVAMLGFIFGLYTIINKIINPSILSGYSSLMAIILFIGGIVMMMIGLIGEYIGRIYISINNSPQYVIRETVNINESEKNR